MTVDFLLFVGLVGSVLALIAFFFNQTGRLSVKSSAYDSLNAVSSFLLVVYAYTEHAWPFVLTNTVWFLVSFRDVLAALGKRQVASKGKKR